MARPSESERIFLAGPRHGIAIAGLMAADARDLRETLFRLIPQWPVLPFQPGNRDIAPDDVSIRRQGGQWRVQSPHVALSDYDLDDGYMAANTLIGALIAAYVAQDDNLVSIHAGAVRIGDGLALLLGDNGAGKSTLAAALAARGQRFYADDRLIVNLADGKPAGRSLAIAPKLRLPLPPDADQSFRSFIKQHAVLSWPGMTVLRPGPEQAASFGEELPLKALIQLRRAPEARLAVLSEMRQPHMVRLLLEQLFAPHLGRQGELSACVRLAQGAGIWQLHYSSACHAADRVIDHFGGGGEA